MNHRDTDRYYSTPSMPSVFDSLFAIGLGAVLAIVAMSLSTPQKRRQLRGKVKELMDDGRETIDHLHDEVEDVKTEGRKRIAKELRRASDEVEPKKA
jgi:gas vesicle protein